MRTPFHKRWAPKNAPTQALPPPEEQARFQELLRQLFQFDCADLDFGIYRIMNHKREVIDRYIDRELPGAIEEAVSQGALETEAKRANTFEETRQQLVEFFGEDAIAPNGELVKYEETPLGKKYMLWRARARHAESAGDVRRDIYNHLYAFFSRYYQDGDFVPKRRYSWEHPYVVPYNGEEVHFHWANRDQYYVKSAEHFKDYTYRTPSGVSIRFFLRTADIDQNDVKGKKRFFFPRLDAAEWHDASRTLDLPFDHRPLTPAEATEMGRNVQQDAILERSEAAIPESLGEKPHAVQALLDRWGGTEADDAPTLFTHHARRFARRITSDYFIHRDLMGFLARELDFYLKSEVLSLGAIEAGGEMGADAWLDKMRVIREVGGSVIDFLAQIEGFQKMLWEKRKFVADVQYCVAARLLPEELHPLLLECDEQWNEWRALGCLSSNEFPCGRTDDTASRRDFLARNPGILIDTRHFDSAFVDALLAALDDIDGKTDGLLVKSENWQALNLLEERYRRVLSCVYIDPPYNAKSSEILYKNDYKHSSWLALMSDRIGAARALMAEGATFVTAIDEVEQERLGQLLSLHFPDFVKNCVVVTHNPSGQQGDNFSYTHEYAYFLHAQPGRYIAEQVREDEAQWDERNFRDVTGEESLRTSAKNCFYPILVRDDEVIGFGDVCPDDYHPSVNETLDDDEGTIAVYPVDPQGVERKWRFARSTVEEIRGELKAHWLKRRGVVDIKRVKKTFNYKSNWADSRYSANNHGTQLLNHLIPDAGTLYPKSIYTVRDCVHAALNGDKKGLVVDYFAGSGTTGHAVINLNREDGGRRKFILVEMGEHFDTVIIPRLKKVAFSREWKNGTAKREATAEASERGPRIMKYFRLESYEDALNNIEFEEAEESLFELEDYLLQYMLRWETKGSATLLNIAALEKPFDYKLRLGGNGDGTEERVDLAETFNYLLGLAVRTRRTYDDDGRRYLVYAGETRDGSSAVVIWRNTEKWTAEDRERDRDFVAKHEMTAGADEIWMNGDSMVEDARPLENLFKQRMFASADG
ncbi:DNA methyltransferase [Candidatus Palauibacter sp.]|uniref:DNA methyltransferase n=1 Tax=Candidatus Palauibacter sp. TaxID=3101350 RepID=UPI003B5C5071